jgi:hypothetical protein
VSRAQRETTIEINGRLYNAVTGQLLEKAPQSAKKKPSKRQPQPAAGVSLDGFVNTPAASQAEIKPPPVQAPPRKPRAATHVHHRTKKSRTLNRNAVTPPPAHLPAVHQSSAKTDSQPPSKHSLVAQVQSTRKARAAGVSKSPHISRYGTTVPTQPEREQPEPPEEHPVQPANLQTQTVPATAPPAHTLPNQPQTAQPQSEPTVPTEDKPSLFKRTGDWIANKRMSSLVATSLAAVLLIGYVTYLNIPRIALRVAAGRAGFEAQMPSYSPSGFAFSGPVAYSPGQITLQYSSNTDERNYTITQRETTWDSQTLLDNHILQETELYSTYQERGLTVYVYDGSTASWVNGGIWYTVSGDSELTAEQLLKIAASL